MLSSFADRATVSERKCSVEGCDRRVSARDLCKNHYEMQRRFGRTKPSRATARQPRFCGVAGCARPHMANGFCLAHYARVRDGKPLDKPLKALKGENFRWLQAHINHSGDECLVWPFSRSRGYGTLHYRGKQLGAHRLMCILAHGQAPFVDAEAAHTCGRGAEGCVNPNHLRWATAAENVADKWAHGTMLRGEDFGGPLSQAQVLEIVAHPGPDRLLAEIYGVTQSTVSAIKRGDSWAWLTGIEQQPRRRGPRKLRLSDEDVREIRRSDETLSRIAARFAISPMMACEIRRRRKYRHVD